jgi:hypothetical protein
MTKGIAVVLVVGSGIDHPHAFLSLEDRIVRHDGHLIGDALGSDHAVERVPVQRGKDACDGRVLESIFDPFITSKPEGLGRACRSVAPSSNATAVRSAANNPDRGAKFSITLPVAHE